MVSKATEDYWQNIVSELRRKSVRKIADRAKNGARRKAALSCGEDSAKAWRMIEGPAIVASLQALRSRAALNTIKEG